MSEKHLRVAVLAASLGLAAVAFADEGPEQLVWTKSGGFVRGTLVELAPSDHVTVKLATGEIRRIPWSDVDRTSAAGATSSAATPPSSPSSAPPPPSAPRPPSSAPPPTASSSSALPSSSAWVRVVSDRPVFLESRPRLEGGAWSRVCASPCGDAVRTSDVEFRVAGEGVSPSNHFLVDGGGSARVSVSTGSASARRLGLWSLFAGIPISLGGGAMVGASLIHDPSQGGALRTSGIVVTSLGAALLLTSIPLLVSGTTNVRNTKGDAIAGDGFSVGSF